jgi:dihydrofolate reductase
MGRKTFDSFPGLLPNRKHIVISKKLATSFPDNIVVVKSFEDALKETEDDKNPFIIGGGQIYKLAMDLSDKIELTRVHENFEADTFFPKINTDKWKLINSEKYEKDERHDFSYTYKTYIKNN